MTNRGKDHLKQIHLLRSFGSRVNHSCYNHIQIDAVSFRSWPNLDELCSLNAKSDINAAWFNSNLWFTMSTQIPNRLPS